MARKLNAIISMGAEKKCDQKRRKAGETTTQSEPPDPNADGTRKRSRDLKDDDQQLKSNPMRTKARETTVLPLDPNAKGLEKTGNLKTSSNGRKGNPMRRKARETTVIALDPNA